MEGGDPGILWRFGDPGRLWRFGDPGRSHLLDVIHLLEHFINRLLRVRLRHRMLLEKGEKGGALRLRGGQHTQTHRERETHTHIHTHTHTPPEKVREGDGHIDTRGDPTRLRTCLRRVASRPACETIRSDSMSWSASGGSKCDLSSTDSCPPNPADDAPRRSSRSHRRSELLAESSLLAGDLRSERFECASAPEAAWRPAALSAHTPLVIEMAARASFSPPVP